jgi:hypothetical protein
MSARYVCTWRHSRTNPEEVIDVPWYLSSFSHKNSANILSTRNGAASRDRTKMVDILLTTITLIVAVIGTLLKDPKPRVKAFLIGLAVLASLGSVIKAMNDQADKEFMKRALTSTLTPSSSSYAKLSENVHVVVQNRGFSGHWNYFHSPDGLTCFFSSEDGSKHGTLVFNRSEMAQMYANLIARRNNDKDVEAAFEQSYVPKELEEEFMDKVGVLGFAVFFDMFGRYPKDSNYDDSGIRITIEENGKSTTVGFSRDELAQFGAAKAPNLFYGLEQRFRQKYKQEIDENRS